MPASASPLPYGLGFVAATLVLHAIGLGLGGLSNWAAGRVAMRGTGAAIAVASIALLVT